ncbi:MarR family transcriptional regulator [Salinibacterium sp. G-O1]|uniref:MarR family winged helix-turn-helix transcriptional regulator n=1 Tax=Salinibacterium sp. G-O1 TaxID=3046208 RepID=UPI0024B9F072|nr:MarR family transcriptional regulator [Salinibacterium sp. G-O1]MDJ0336342.1 MarR family transcriptional regulator [Salinibacterium sp. G-O1]
MSEKALSVDAWEALFRAQVSVLRQLIAEFPKGELSLNEYDVLFNLTRAPDRQMRIRELNQHLLITQPSVSRLVDRLASQDLVCKEHDPDDGRGTMVRLTDAGYELFRRIAVVHAASIHRRVGAALTDAELTSLKTLTDKLRLNPGA